MNEIKTAEEIGFVQSGINLVEVMASESIREKVGAVMPLPPENLNEHAEKMASYLASLGKTKMMFLSPVIALFDLIPKYMEDAEAIVLISSDMEEEIRDRLAGNMPKDMEARLWHEPLFPDDLYPNNSLIVACGYMANDRLMVLPATYRMIMHYRESYYGKMVFLPYITLDEAVKYDGWIEIGADKFELIWRDDE